MLHNVLAVFWLCSPLVLKQVGTPCWGQWQWERHTRGQVPWWVPCWGARAMTWDMQIDTQLAACVVRPPMNKGMPDIPMALWIFLLHKYHEPAWPWRVATQGVWQNSVPWSLFSWHIIHFFFKPTRVFIILLRFGICYFPSYCQIENNLFLSVHMA